MQYFSFPHFSTQIPSFTGVTNFLEFGGTLLGFFLYFFHSGSNLIFLTLFLAFLYFLLIWVLGFVLFSHKDPHHSVPKPWLPKIFYVSWYIYFYEFYILKYFPFDCFLLSFVTFHKKGKRFFPSSLVFYFNFFVIVFVFGVHFLFSFKLSICVSFSFFLYSICLWSFKKQESYYSSHLKKRVINSS